MGSRPKCVPAPRAARPSCWCARPSGSRRNGPCTRASARASRRAWRACTRGSRGRASQSIAAPPSVRSAACSAATRAPPPAMPSTWSRIRRGRPGCASTGRCGPNGTTGRATAKAATCCAPICATGPPTRCGGPISSSPRRKRPSASTRATSRSARLASAPGSRPGPSPGLLPGLRALENARAVAEPGRSRQLSAYHPPGTHSHPERRCRPADRGGAAARVALALRRAARSRPGHPARTARTTLARTVAHACRCTANVVPTRRPKSLKILV